MENKASAKTVLSKYGTLVLNVFLSVFKYILHNMIHGIFCVKYLGKRKIIPKIKNDLLLQPADRLAEKIRRGELSSETLVKAYVERIVEVNGFINAVVDSRFPEALEEAHKVDQLVQSGYLTENQMAEDLPLLGIPFTAKESLSIKGLSNTAGMVSRKGRIAENDCESVARMRSCGAIPVAVTLIPEMCLWMESTNKLHGSTRNPYDTRKTSGGSSGGEAAIIGSAGSAFGLGSDLFGSISCPAFFNGVFGHKPTVGLVPTGGLYPPVSKSMEKSFAVGPIVRYAADLKLVLSSLIGKEAIQELKLKEPVDVKSIKVYYMLDNGDESSFSWRSPVSSEIQIRIKKVVDTLSKEGFTVKKANLEYLKYEEIWNGFGKGKNINVMNLMQKDARMNQKLFLLKELCKSIFGKSKISSTILQTALVQDFIRPLFQKRLNLIEECRSKLKQELLELLEPEPTVLLYPTHPEVAPYLGQVSFKFYDIAYSANFGIAALPVTQCPLGIGSSGLPLGMQIVTAPMNDRYSLALAEYIEKKFGGWVQPS